MLLKPMFTLAEPTPLPCTLLGMPCPDIERAGALAHANAWEVCLSPCGAVPRNLLASGCFHVAFVHAKADLPDAEAPRLHRRFRLVKIAIRVEHEGALAA